MKKLLFVFLSLCLTAGALVAQDLAETIKEAGKAAGDAEKAINVFALDNSNKEKLSEALENAKLAQAAVKDITEDQLAKAFANEKKPEKAIEKAKGDLSQIWASIGRAYNEVATQLLTASQLGLDKAGIPDESYPALQAAKAYEQALALSTGKSDAKTAVDGLSAAQGALNNMATIAFEQDKDFAKAYLNFNEVLVAHELIKANEGVSLLDAEGALNDQRYYTGLAGMNANMTNQVTPLFEKLYEAKYDNPFIYEAMYRIHKDEDIDKAFGYLQAGREANPDDTGLLFAEINHFLSQNKLDELIGELKLAISKEPDNISLYATLGNVYDQLYQREAKAEDGDKAKSMEYFDNALSYFNQALEKDEKYFDAVYSIGALHYNNAAILVTELQAMEEDYSKEGIKKYEAKKAEIFQKFDDALPWFQRCEKLNPNDTNTLIALREIYARKDDLATSNVFKERLEKVQAGGKNEKSYFQEK